MIIACPACGTRYVVPDTAIGVEGRTVRCAKCKHSWFQDPKPLDLPEEGASTETTGAKESEQASAPKTETGAAPSINRWHSGDRPDATEPAASPAPAAPPKTATAPVPPPPTPPAPVAEEPSDQFLPGDDPLANETIDEDFGGTDTAFEDDDYEDDESRFDYRPPFSRRRNSVKMWTIAAGIFAVLASGTAVAVNYYGLPDWLPIQQPTFGVGKTNLELDFPAQSQRKETLETGEEIFRVRGSINNTGSETQSVPSLLIVFRDEREKNVYSWVVVPSKRELAPGESLNVTEAVTDIPAAARAAEIGWSPN